jgi:hypothetical protein
VLNYSYERKIRLYKKKSSVQGCVEVTDSVRVQLEFDGENGPLNVEYRLTNASEKKKAYLIQNYKEKHYEACLLRSPPA